ncbi:MAG: hypothetical protein ACRCXB_25055 [Aeromonadaceae bacterium]
MAHVNFENTHLAAHQTIVTKHRKFGLNEASQGRDPIIKLMCSGGCNQFHRVRASKIGQGNIFVCNDKATRGECQRSLPRAVQGKVRVIRLQQAGKLAGVTYEDKGRWAAIKAATADIADGFIQSLTSLGLRKD